MEKTGVGVRLREIRQSLGLNQKEFCELLGVPRQNYLSRYENEEHEFDDCLKLQLGHVIREKYGKRISLDWFLTGEGEMFQASLPVKSKYGLAKSEEGFKVPLLRQKVSCGPGVNWEDEQNISDYIDIFNMIPCIKITRQFALCVSGNSMIGAGIRDGDYVVFDGEYDQESRDGIYVFALDGEVYCKLLEFDMTKIKIFSVRFGDLDKSELMVTLDAKDMATADRFTIFGRVLYWFHPNTWNN